MSVCRNLLSVVPVLLKTNTIYEKIVSRQILNLKENSKTEQITFSGIDYYLSRIKEAKNSERELISESDNTL
jgi:hypothetical protein